MTIHLRERIFTNVFFVSGFDRKLRYANAMQNILNTSNADDSLDLPANFNNHVNHIVAALWTHLTPILRLNPDHPRLTSGATTPPIPNDVFDPLYKLVTEAGLLSVHMHVDPHTVFYFEPVYKDDKYSAARMECFNIRDMQLRNPHYTPEEILKLEPEEQARRATLSDAEKKRAKTDEALTQITIMDGVTVYRRGGWEEPGSRRAGPMFEKPEYGHEGVRQLVLTHGWVFCRWGRACQFKDGKPVSGDKKIHGEAWNGGFVQFTDVEGVYSWLETERKARKEAIAEVLQKRKAKAPKGKGKGKAKAATLDDVDRS